MRLTEKNIRDFKSRGKTLDVLWDGEVKGFGVRVYPSGVKSFVLTYDDRGKTKVVTLARYGDVTLGAARDRARAFLASQGHTEHIREIRVDALAREYLQRYSRLHRASWKDDERRIELKIIPALGDMRIADVKPLHLVRLHADISARYPVEANRVVELFRAIWNKAQTWEYIGFNQRNPANAVRRNREVKRDRWVTPDEMPALLAAIRAEHNVYARAAILLYLLIGVRKKELLCARWVDVDFSLRTLKIVKTKSRRPYSVALGDHAVAVLNDIPRQSRNPFIICGRNPGAHLVCLNKPWNRVRTAAGLKGVAGLKDVTIHDLRRTFGNWMRLSGADVSYICDAYGHANIRTTMRYLSTHQPALCDAMNAHGENLFSCAQPSV